MKTPDEIKKGLCCCSSDEDGCNCEHCPYNLGLLESGCIAMFAVDALAYIQQLERERDAAVEDIFQTCSNCKHEKLGYGVGPCPPVEEYAKMIDCSNWQWRGVQEVMQ